MPQLLYSVWSNSSRAFAPTIQRIVANIPSTVFITPSAVRMILIWDILIRKKHTFRRLRVYRVFENYRYKLEKRIWSNEPTQLSIFISLIFLTYFVHWPYVWYTEVTLLWDKMTHSRGSSRYLLFWVFVSSRMCCVILNIQYSLDFEQYVFNSV